MKKHYLFSLLAILCLSVTACDLSIELPPINGSSSTSFSTSEYTSDNSSSGSSSGSSNSSSNSGSSSSSSSSSSTSSSFTLPSNFISLSTSNVSLETRYASNFAVETISNFDFNFYRYGSPDNGGLVKLYGPDYIPDYKDIALNGAIYNEEAILGIKRIDISASSYDFVLRYGIDPLYGNEITNPKEKNYINLDGVNFFMLEVKSTLTINEITIYYEDVGEYIETTHYINQGRRVSVSTPSKPVEGEVRSIYGYVNNNLVPLSYTYHTFEYAQNNPSLIDEIAYTNPADVMNYFLLFNEVPANYGTKNAYYPDVGANQTVYAVKDIFGSLARQISYYTRDDGYATSIPYNVSSYYELDIALNDNYSTNSRDVGRIVLFPDGFNCYSDSTPVGLLTTDHYITFSEYSNRNQWNELFDTYTSTNSARGHRVFRSYSQCQTLTI